MSQKQLRCYTFVRNYSGWGKIFKIKLNVQLPHLRRRQKAQLSLHVAFFRTLVKREIKTKKKRYSITVWGLAPHCPLERWGIALAPCLQGHRSALPRSAAQMLSSIFKRTRQWLWLSYHWEKYKSTTWNMKIQHCCEEINTCLSFKWATQSLWKANPSDRNEWNIPLLFWEVLIRYVIWWMAGDHFNSRVTD